MLTSSYSASARLRKPPHADTLENCRNFSAIAAWYGGEVKRYLRLAKLAEDKRKSAQLLRQAIIHAKAAWFNARRSCKEDKE